MTSHSLPPPPLPALCLDRITGAIFDVDSVVTATASATARAWTRLFDAAAYPATIQLIRDLRRCHVRTAVVSAGRHCEQILVAAGVAHLFDAIVDGIDADVPGAHGMAGTPGKIGSKTFLLAAERIGVAPSHCAVLEGGAAGAAEPEAFGMVIGIDRTGDRTGCRPSRGTDVVVRNLAEVCLVERPGERFGTGDERPLRSPAPQCRLKVEKEVIEHELDQARVRGRPAARPVQQPRHDVRRVDAVAAVPA